MAATVLNGLWNWLSTVDWLALISGAAVATIGLGLRLLMRAPLKAIGRDARFVRWFSFVYPQKPFDRAWLVTWHVESSRFPPQNSDTVIVHRFFKQVTFRTTAHLSDGETEDCIFIGKLHHGRLTGRWYNPADEDHGYYGVFQMQLHPGLRQAEGAWAGFSKDGKIQSNLMSMMKVAQPQEKA